MKNPTKTFNIIASAVGLILTLGTVFISASSVSASSGTPVALVTTTTTAAGPVDTSAVTQTNTSGYTDGTYSASASYRTPGSSESIQVTLTLSNGVVTNAAIAQSERDPESRRYQNNFAASYTSQVVGKSISNLNLSRISGASLTTNGFDSALSEIKSEAAA